MYGVLEVDEGYSGMSNDEVVPIQVSVGNPQLDPKKWRHIDGRLACLQQFLHGDLLLFLLRIRSSVGEGYQNIKDTQVLEVPARLPSIPPVPLSLYIFICIGALSTMSSISLQETVGRHTGLSLSQIQKINQLASN